MNNRSSFFATWSPRMLSILRIVAAFVFIAHGAMKLFGFPVPMKGGAPPLMSLFGVSGVLEFFGGLLLLLGLFTRPVAFILAGEMAVAYFMMHASSGTWLWPVLNQGEPAVLNCFVFLYLSVAGGGPWSLDHLLRRRR